MRRYQYEINEIHQIFEAEGIAIPQDLSTSMTINDRLDDLLDTLADEAYDRGMDSAHACCNDDCQSWY
jgi:hypothetical protein